MATRLNPSNPSSIEKPQPSIPPVRTHPSSLNFMARCLVAVIALVFKLWTRTLRVSSDPASRAIFENTPSPAVALMWHNQLFLALSLLPHRTSGGGLVALVSASRDGAWLTELLGRLKVSTVRGSSSRFGRQALAALIRTLQAGRDVVITPDGPRGPAYSLEAGAIVAALRADAELVLVGGIIHSAWRLNSWDGFFIPKPFSKVQLYGDRISQGQLHSMKEPEREIQERLYRLSGLQNEFSHRAPAKFRKGNRSKKSSPPENNFPPRTEISP